MSDATVIFGKNLLELISQRNWSIQQAAKELDCDRGNLSKITIGSKNFKLETAVKYARFFNVSVFLMFSRLFENREYRLIFPFVEENYMNVIRINFTNGAARQADVALDPTTMSKIMNGHYNNLTIGTLSKLAEAGSVTLSELLKTKQDKTTEIMLKGELE